MGWTVLLVSSLLLMTGNAKPSEKISLKANTLMDVTSYSAPAYWSAHCGDRTYVGSYTLMMEWNDCKDYCHYFPHAGDLGHTFQFADILDSDTMECLRYNMNAQYTPGNGYAGHYWAGGVRVKDGEYRWESGEEFNFDDFVNSPGNDPFIHLTPGNNYAWNLKNDQDDRNNGCLCKSEQSMSEKEVKASECPAGWLDIGSKCLRMTYSIMRQTDAADRCAHYGAELVSWKDKGEYISLSIYMQEWNVNSPDKGKRFWTSGNDNEFEGDWVWGSGDDFVPMDYGWADGEPKENWEIRCSMLRADNGLLYANICDSSHWEEWNYPLCQIMK